MFGVSIFRQLLAAFLLLGAATTGFGQGFPNKPIRLVVQLGSGGSTDVAMRLVAQQMGPLLGQTVVVENKAGANGLLAMNELLRSEPDGYTLASAEAGQWAILPASRTDLAYQPQRDFAPVGLVFEATPFIVARDSLPVGSLKELIALVKAKPGTLSYGVPALGGVHHIAMESLKAALGLDIQVIGYKGGGQSVEALTRGDIPLVMSGVVAASSLLQAGKAKLLAYTGRARAKEAPDLPTVAEVTGIPDLYFLGQSGLLAPRGTPRDVIDRLSAALGKAAMHPDVVARAAKFGIWMTPSSPEQLAEVMRDDLQKYAKAVKVTGIRLQ